MRFSSFLDFLLPASQLAISSSDPLQPLTISAPGINATFIGYGATLTHLFVNDREGLPRDVAVGYDTPAEYVRDTETKHTYFGAVVGYVNAPVRCRVGVQMLMPESVGTPIGSRMGRL
jgi:aldose 1-epimerase